MKKLQFLSHIGRPVQYAGNLLLIVFFLLMNSNLDAQQEKRGRYLDGGKISTKDNTTICIDGNSTPINVYLRGDRGKKKQWIITDDKNNILALPKAPPFDFENAGAGVCKIWHVSYWWYVRNLKIGKNLSRLRGWYDLSNSIEVVRNDPKGGTLSGGPFEFTVGNEEADNILEGAIILEGNSGGNSQWVVTDAEGNILGLPPSPYVVDFDGAGPGTCLVWHLSFDGDIEGAEQGKNASDLIGCYSLSNPIEVIRNSAIDGGTLSGGPFEYCVGDGIADNIPEGAIALEGNSGENSQWVVTDADGNILGLPPTPYVVDFDGAGPGTCLVWHLSFNGEIEGAEQGKNASDLVGDYDLSNPIEVVRNEPKGGTLSGGPFEFTVGDGVADNIPEGAITLEGNSGGNSQWVVTDADGNILGLPPSPYVVDFDGAGPGTCLVWHLSFDGDIEGAEQGKNASDLVGCYSLSNSIEVIRNYAKVDGGTLSGGPFEYCVGDGIADNIPEGAITLEGNAGANSQWVVTDAEGNILGLPPTPYVVDFDGAGAGTCLVWHLSFNGDIEGAEQGKNASDLVGDYDLSNPIEVVRNEPKGGTLSGGPFEFTVSDGVSDNIPEGAITLEGNSGGNSQWVVTDAEGNILGLPPSPYVVDFDGAGQGTCLVWHLSFNGDIEGAEQGKNASDLIGCYSLSNPIEVIRNSAIDGGTLSGGPFEYCVGDGIADNIPEGAITLEGNSGENSQWVVTDADGNILGLPPTPYVVDFDGAGPGTCLVWHLSFNGNIEGAEQGKNASDLVGDYDLSNPIEVVRNEPKGGTLSGGPFEFTVGDGVADNIPEGAITLEGNSGGNSQWVVTDAEGNILGLPPSPYVVDFDGAGQGTCLVWHLSFDGDIEGAEQGKNASDLIGCYSLSNPIEVIRTDKVEPVCDLNGGYIKAGGLYLFCEGDGNDDFATGIKLHNNKGYNSQWVVTDVEGNILGLPPSPDVVNFDGAGPGVCLIWHLSFNTIYGAEQGNNAFTDLSGCYDLSNPIPVFRFPSDSAVCDLINYANHHESKSAKISMHPNPARNNLKIDLSGIDDEDVTVKIYNFSSREVINKSVNMKSENKKTINLNISSLPQGLYLVSITNKDNSIKTVKRLLVE